MNKIKIKGHIHNLKKFFRIANIIYLQECFLDPNAMMKKKRLK